ncbi:MAG TPA: Mur ligase domain-containing protein, partial [Terrimesophilobacter sp.]|nr:Mur ligase domain-containing protein [Terrimesophilobacter sp.]
MIKSDFRHDVPADPGTVHFVGIGGAGMSGIARLFVDAGIRVTGSDSRDTDTVRALRELGIPVHIGHSAGHVGDASTLVVTGAISESNPEYREAVDRGIPTVHRAKALAWLTRGRRLVAVAGAHGKTTSTAMVVTALRGLGVDAGFVNGGVIRSLGVSAASGDDDIFVVEADESDGSFLLYDTAVALITNVDPDHLDFFGSEQNFLDAFVDFAGGAREAVVVSADDEGARAITPRFGADRVTTFGEHPESDVRVHSVRLGVNTSFTVSWNGEEYPATLTVPGLHNVLNAAGAFGVLVRLGFDARASLDAI